MRRIWVVLAVVALAGTAGWAGWAIARNQAGGDNEVVAPPTATATVVRTDLATSETFEGELRYGDVRSVRAAAPGTVTLLPTEAARVDLGEVLFELNGVPVVLLAGERPAWRPFAEGMDDGPDVTQLEENLLALGLVDALTVDDVFGDETADVIERYREEYGLPEGRGIELGTVVFLPGPVRVGAMFVELGAAVAPGTPLFEVSSFEQEVVIRIDPERVDVLTAGAEVKVTLPDERVIDGEIVEIGKVVKPVSLEPEAARVIEVRLTLSGSGLDLDLAPVDVEVVTDLAEGVLAVPVRALLALVDGGYALEVERGGGTVLVGVDLGVFAEGLVEVSGGIAEGDVVVIPA